MENSSGTLAFLAPERSLTSNSLTDSNKQFLLHICKLHIMYIYIILRHFSYLFKIYYKINKLIKFIENSSGTLAFLAPERSLSNVPYNGFQADIWAVGITIYLLVFG